MTRWKLAAALAAMMLAGQAGAHGTQGRQAAPAAPEQLEEADDTTLLCDAPPRANRWLADFYDRIQAHDMLYQLAVQVYGRPPRCGGEVTQVERGLKYGLFLYRWDNGVEFDAQTRPADVTLVTLRVPEGFDDSANALATVKQYLLKRGLTVDWKNPKQGSEAARTAYEYQDAEENPATRLRLEYNADRKLVLVRLESGKTAE